MKELGAEVGGGPIIHHGLIIRTLRYMYTCECYCNVHTFTSTCDEAVVDTTVGGVYRVHTLCNTLVATHQTLILKVPHVDTLRGWGGAGSNKHHSNTLQ